MRKTVVMLTLMSFAAALATFLTCADSHAEEGGWKSIGARASLSATPNGSFFHQYELSTVYALPWRWRSDSGWGIGTQVEGAAGVLHSAGLDSFIGSVGPDFAVDKDGMPLELEFGVDLALLSRPYFRHESFDGDFQFISHVGLNYRFMRKLGIGYRFQHMSNAGLYRGFNPGLNVHMILLNYYLGE